MSEAIAPAPAAAPVVAPVAPSGGLLGRFAAWCSERSNPILVRYVRQQLRSRAFFIVFSTMLGFATLFSLTVGAGAENRSEGSAAAALFGLLTAIWTFAVWVFEPISAFRAMAAERDDKTWDLLRLTGLSPGRLVRGMFLASVFQGAIYAATIAPFLVMAYLLRGIALADIALILVLVPVAGWCASAGAIFLGAVGSSRGARNALGVLVAITAGFIWLSSLTAWLSFEFIGQFFLDDLVDGPALAFALDFAVIWIGGALVLGAAVLRHPASNRSTAPRAYAFLILLNGAVWALVVGAPFTSEALIVAAFLASITTVLMGVFAVTEANTVTPRQARESAAMRWWALPVLFAPGGARGRFAYVALVALVLASAWLGLSGLLSGVVPVDLDAEPVVFTALILAHGSILIAVCDGLARTLFKRSLATPAARRLFILATFFGLAFVGTVISSVVGGGNTLVALFPVPGMGIIVDRPGTYEDALFLILLAGAVSALALLVQGFRAASVLRRTTSDDQSP